MARTLIDISDDLGDVRDLVEVGFMAAHKLEDASERKAFAALFATIGDTLRDTIEALDAFRAGGARG